MPQPTYRQVHVNKPLTQISVAYIQNQNAFIAGNVFPTIPVPKQSDRYFKYLRSDWFRSEAQERAPATESAGSGFRIDNTPTYYCPVIAIHKDVDDQIRANADNPIDMDRDATEWVTQQLLLKREQIWVENNFQSGVWGADYQGVASSPGTGEFLQWDQADSTPIEDVTDRGIEIAQLTGFRPNVLVLSPFVFNSLRHHPDVLDRIKYTQTGIVTTDLLASLFDVDRVLVPWGVINNAGEQTGTDHTAQNLDMNFIFGRHALLVYANPSPSILQPSGGYTFAWTGYLGAGPQGTRMRTFRMEELVADRIEGEGSWDMKVIAPDLGAFFIDAVGS